MHCHTCLDVLLQTSDADLRCEDAGKVNLHHLQFKTMTLNKPQHYQANVNKSYLSAQISCGAQAFEWCSLTFSTLTL